ncbi:hypothetical protein NP493_140g04004 [Ridgeia piscesae]|uniref:Uncharacterized protein n=1 Tax=Ridgeia piscesae TaxID=27915 RepID=A0AAD9P4X0_RIDPI|nr:hypothetical protein NP493_140g04004 [Ridgeia piscesae]
METLTVIRLGLLLLLPLAMWVGESEGYYPYYWYRYWLKRKEPVFNKCHNTAKLHSCNVGCGMRGCTKTCRGYAYCHCYGDDKNMEKYYASCTCCPL